MGQKVVGVTDESAAIDFVSLWDLFFTNEELADRFANNWAEDVDLPHFLQTSLTDQAELCRKTLMAMCQIDSEVLSKQLKEEDKASVALYRGFSRFMLEDLAAHPSCEGKSVSQRKKVATKVAREMIKVSQFEPISCGPLSLWLPLPRRFCPGCMRITHTGVLRTVCNIHDILLTTIFLGSGIKLIPTSLNCSSPRTCDSPSTRKLHPLGQSCWSPTSHPRLAVANQTALSADMTIGAPNLAFACSQKTRFVPSSHWTIGMSHKRRISFTYRLPGTTQSLKSKEIQLFTWPNPASSKKHWKMVSMQGHGLEAVILPMGTSSCCVRRVIIPPRSVQIAVCRTCTGSL